MAVISVADLKAHLNIVDAEDDGLLAQYLEAAEGWIEIFTGISFSTYYDDATQAYSVPGPLKHAIRMLAASFYENREDVIVGISAESVPHGVHDLIAPFRTWSF